MPCFRAADVQALPPVAFSPYWTGWMGIDRPVGESDEWVREVRCFGMTGMTLLIAQKGFQAHDFGQTRHFTVVTIKYAYTVVRVGVKW